MLNSLLALVAALCLQETPAAQDPAAPSAPAVEAAAPTETDPSVRAFLIEAESHLYDPQAAGLSSVEFDVAVTHPAFGTLGNAHVNWTSTGGMVVNVTPAESSQFPAETIQGVGQQMGSQFLGYMLNKPISPMLEGSVASMAGVEGGLVKVKFTNPEAMAQGLKEQALFFDDEGMLKRMAMATEMQGQSITMVQFFEWKPVAEGRDVYIADSQRTETTMDTPMGPMKVPGSVAFTYVTVGDLVVATSVSTTQDVPMQGKMTQTLAATNLKVNGQPVGG